MCREGACTLALSSAANKRVDRRSPNDTRLSFARVVKSCKHFEVVSRLFAITHLRVQCATRHEHLV